MFILGIKVAMSDFGRLDPKILIINSIGILMGVEKVTSFHFEPLLEKVRQLLVAVK